MVTRHKGQPQPNSPVEWLEKDLLETKARLHKVESELSHALKQTYVLDADLRKLMEALNVSGSVEASIQSFREEVRQVRDLVGKIQDRQAAIAGRVEQVQNQRQAEVGRDRADLGVLVKQIDSIARTIDHYDGRLKGLEEATRHVEEEVAGSRLSAQAAERLIDDLNTRSARVQEATLRLDQQFSQFGGDLQKLQKDDESLADRMSLVLEQLRRALERLDKLELAAGFPDEAREQFQRASAERDLLAQRVAGVEHLVTEIAERTDEFVRGIARIDQRSQLQGSELITLSGRVQDLEEQVKSGFKKVYQTFLRQRRRRSEALNQEIKELTQGELHAGD